MLIYQRVKHGQTFPNQNFLTEISLAGMIFDPTAGLLTMVYEWAYGKRVRVYCWIFLGSQIWINPTVNIQQ